MPYVWKMLGDIGSIRSCWVLLFFYVLFDFAAALIPAASLCLLSYAKRRVSYPLSARLKQHYSIHIFEARARLDVPTFEDPAVQRQLDSASSFNGQSVAWGTFTMVSGLATTAVKVVTQVSVLADVLKTQQDGPLLALLSFVPSLGEWLGWQRASLLVGGG
ncbi:hypothetical protein PHLCEN_2v3592 [Hermanssonia centrifuga]|uniref:Uncharacterized protein n=1 Tax=Hermanssonia centrifuga TaxID=98765 RepID=A0A2R6QES8_9APHY|nr:hypothetical protein PHLCEN_2v3592 [Hermanssonia centrifuga]